MKQKFSFNPTYKQTFHLNMKMQNSLDFLKLGENDIQSLIHTLLQSNPFVDINEDKDTTYFSYDMISKKRSLKDDLYLQAHLLKEKYDEEILAYMIESLDSRGFLTLNKKQYLLDLNIDEKTWDYHLKLLQSFEPLGVGASDSFNSLEIQLNNKREFLAAKIIKESKNLILNKNYKAISKTYHINNHTVEKVFEAIKDCHPFPCFEYDKEENSYIIPDIEIIVDGEDILIEPYNEPSFQINHELYEMVKDNKQMQEYFKEAHFFIDNLNKRNQTLMMVTSALVNIQKNFFLYDDELAPCTLEDIASICHYHVSTISRTVNDKYFMFHNETYPLKKLLVSRSSLGDSSDAIKKAMKELIDNEDKTKPLSDQQIVDALSEIDLNCSRRVINKYRKQMGIPSSSQKKNKINLE